MFALTTCFFYVFHRLRVMDLSHVPLRPWLSSVFEGKTHGIPIRGILCLNGERLFMLNYPT